MSTCNAPSSGGRTSSPSSAPGSGDVLGRIVASSRTPAAVPDDSAAVLIYACLFLLREFGSDIRTPSGGRGSSHSGRTTRRTCGGFLVADASAQQIEQGRSHPGHPGHCDRRREAQNLGRELEQ